MKILRSCVRDPRRAGEKLSMTRRNLLLGSVILTLVACTETPRTATNFCRVLADRLTELTTAPTNNDDVQQLIEHYDRLVEVAPVEVEDDLATIRDLFVQASEVKVNDPASVQAVADAAYAAERAAQDAGIYVGITCGVDLSTGLAVQVPAETP